VSRGTHRPPTPIVGMSVSSNVGIVVSKSKLAFDSTRVRVSMIELFSVSSPESGDLIPAACTRPQSPKEEKSAVAGSPWNAEGDSDRGTWIQRENEIGNGIEARPL
jgi:hypothetical protein